MTLRYGVVIIAISVWLIKSHCSVNIDFQTLKNIHEAVSELPFIINSEGCADCFANAFVQGRFEAYTKGLPIFLFSFALPRPAGTK